MSLPEKHLRSLLLASTWRKKREKSSAPAHIVTAPALSTSPVIFSSAISTELASIPASTSLPPASMTPSSRTASQSPDSTVPLIVEIRRTAATTGGGKGKEMVEDSEMDMAVEPSQVQVRLMILGLKQGLIMV